MILPKPLWWILSLTWGLTMTLAGFCVALVLMLLGYKPKRNLYGWYFEIGEDGWGGFNLGPISLTCHYPTRRLLNHEFGHSVHNCYFGPLVWFIITLPSVIRYWYREYLVNCRGKKYSDLPAYDAIWFEGTATEIGARYNEVLQNK